MVDYQTAVAAVQDPQADPILLAKIAYENPEFGANVAVHPRAYPGLKRWLAEFGDKRARMTLAQMGVIATADPVEDRFDESETPSGQRNPEPARAVKLAVEQLVRNSGAQQPVQARPTRFTQPAQSTQAAQHTLATQPDRATASNPNAQYSANGEFTPQLAMTTSDPAVMHDIAQYAPDLHVYLVQNPYIYPELLNWLASLNETEVNEAIAACRAR